MNSHSQILSSARKASRAPGGYATEFAPVFSVFVIFGILPLIGCAVMFMRVCVAQALLDHSTQSLARSEKMSVACKSFYGESERESYLVLIGLETTSKSLSLVVGGRDQSQFTLTEPARLSSNWLPSGRNQPSCYVLRATTVLQMKPFFNGQSMLRIPGVTVPLRLALRSDRQWENTSCDPETGEFYINE